MSSQGRPLKEDIAWNQVIRPIQGWFHLDLAEVWRYRDLIWVMVKRDFVSVYKQTILGPIWFLIQPLATTIAFILLFTIIAKIPTGGTPPFLFYLGGLVMWSFCSTSFMKTSDVFATNAGIFGKVYFPRLVVPLAVIINNMITFAIQFALFALVLAIFGHFQSARETAVALLLVPPLLAYVGLLGLGMGIGISSLATRFRDLIYLSGFAVQLWMYATPVAYPLSTVPERFRWLFYFNPMTAPVETFRLLWLGNGIVTVEMWLFGLGLTGVMLLIGLLLFSHMQRTSIDTV